VVAAGVIAPQAPVTPTIRRTAAAQPRIASPLYLD
jgi:hypothetical protein